MRAKALVFTLAMTFAMMTGCAQRFWISDHDYDLFHARNALPLGAERDPYLSVKPTTDFREKPPAIIDPPEREPRPISLAECIAIALERGSTGIQSVRQPGAINEDLLGVTAGGAAFQYVATDSIRVLTLNPALVGAVIDEA